MHLFESPLVRRLMWNLVPLVAIVGALSWALLGEKGLLQRHAVKQQLLARQQQVELLEAENAALATQVRMLRQDRRAVQRAVAEELLLVEPGATIYRFE